MSYAVSDPVSVCCRLDVLKSCFELNVFLKKIHILPVFFFLKKKLLGFANKIC